jgi:hypothetical protein
MTELANPAAFQLVPASYAEKTMASLMQLHAELMDEKERRIELFRKLMEREQAFAELAMYVKVLEGQGAAGQARVDSPAGSPEVMAPRETEPEMVAPVRPWVDGWKAW